MADLVRTCHQRPRKTARAPATDACASRGSRPRAGVRVPAVGGGHGVDACANAYARFRGVRPDVSIRHKVTTAEQPRVEGASSDAGETHEFIRIVVGTFLGPV